MAQHVAVIFVHGIFTSDQDYFLSMKHKIEQALPSRLKPYVAFDSAFWADRVRPRQREFTDRVNGLGLTSSSRYRRFVVEGLGDAAAYQKTRERRNSAYYEIQAKFREAIDRLDKKGHERRPLVLIGHSLGCHILSSFAWDTNTIKQMSDERLASHGEDTRSFARYLRGGSPFRRLDTLAGIVTMGSNMPLFTFTFGADRVIPITRSRHEEEVPAFPGKELDDKLKKRARWVNYYSRHDLLGYPLKPLNDGYATEQRLSDIEVCSEGWRRRIGLSWFPAANAIAAHTGYWENPRVVKGTAKLLQELITAGDPEPRSRFSWPGRASKTKPSVSAPASA